MANKEETEYPEIRIRFSKNDPVYKKICKNAKDEERTPAKEAKIFLKKNYKK